MSVDFNSTPINRSTTSETDAPMFAPIPSWERNKKRRGFGGEQVGSLHGAVLELSPFHVHPLLLHDLT